MLTHVGDMNQVVVWELADGVVVVYLRDQQLISDGRSDTKFLDGVTGEVRAT